MPHNDDDGNYGDKMNGQIIILDLCSIARKVFIRVNHQSMLYNHDYPLSELVLLITI